MTREEREKRIAELEEKAQSVKTLIRNRIDVSIGGSFYFIKGDHHKDISPIKLMEEVKANGMVLDLSEQQEKCDEPIVTEIDGRINTHDIKKLVIELRCIQDEMAELNKIHIKKY